MTISNLFCIIMNIVVVSFFFFFFFQAEDGIRDFHVTGVQTCALPILLVLLIFSAGSAIGCACGPVGMLLQLTGGQHALLRILLIVYPLGLTATIGQIGRASCRERV